MRLRLDLGSAWSVWPYSKAQVQSLTAKELPSSVTATWYTEGPQTDGEETTEGTGRRLGLPPSGGCNGGNGGTGGGDLLLSPPEHRGAIYCDWGNY